MTFSPRRTGDPLTNQNFDAIAKEFQAEAAPTTTLIAGSAFKGAWTAAGGFQAPGYRLWATGELELFGALTGGTSNTIAFTLPLAPRAIHFWAAANWNGSAPVAAFIKLDINGNVIPVVTNHTLVFLDGVRFVPGA